MHKRSLEDGDRSLIRETVLLYFLDISTTTPRYHGALQEAFLTVSTFHLESLTPSASSLTNLPGLNQVYAHPLRRRLEKLRFNARQ
jgi:hypothetical protein